MSTGPRPKGPQPKGPQKKSGGVKVPSTGSGGDSTRRTLIAMGIAGLIVVAAALGYVLLGSGGGSSTDAIKQLEAAGCTVQKVAALPSGDHSVLTPAARRRSGTPTRRRTARTTSSAAIWGAYTTPLYPAQVVHNLEHGGIFIQYGQDVPQATVDQLKGFYDQHLNGTLLAPLPKLGSKIALGVWTTQQPDVAEHRHRVPREVHVVRRRRLRGVLQGVPVQGPRALPGQHAHARHVGAWTTG